jgi:hypothetical protein
MEIGQGPPRLPHGQIYAVEKDVRGTSADARRAARQARSRLLTDALKTFGTSADAAVGVPAERARNPPATGTFQVDRADRLAALADHQYQKPWLPPHAFAPNPSNPMESEMVLLHRTVHLTVEPASSSAHLAGNPICAHLN